MQHEAQGLRCTAACQELQTIPQPVVVTEARKEVEVSNSEFGGYLDHFFPFYLSNIPLGSL